MAGEIGHVVVDPNGRLCRCGQRGCLETVAAGPAIAAAWPDAEPDRAASALFAAYSEGDPAAALLVRRITDYLATAIHWLAAAYDVSTIYLGGGVTSAGPLVLDAVRAALQRAAGGSNLAAQTLTPGRVRLAPPDSSFGALGAAALAARRFGFALAAQDNPTTKGAE